MRYFTNIFLNIESRARSKFEKYPFFHAFLAGVGVILFWRGVWEQADRLQIGPITSIIVGGLLLGAIGLFLQTFVGNTIIIKKVEKEKALDIKTDQDVAAVKTEVRREEMTLARLGDRMEEIEAKLDALINK